MAQYDPLARFYDREYAQKEDDLAFYLEIAAPSNCQILEIGVGTGRVALPLIQAGHSVVGIDSSPSMLQIAHRKLAALPVEEQARLHLICQQMTELELSKGFPLCIIPFRTFLHNLNQNDQLQTLQHINRHLTAEGLLVMDLFVPLYSVVSQCDWRDEWDQADLSPGLRLETQVQHDPINQLLYVRNRYFRKRLNRWKISGEGSYTYRYVFRFEMEALLKIAGFRLLKVFGGFDRCPYDYQSGTMIFVAQKS
ncbi:MAG TPA: class I SAM-dependent methyltransferase [bacterium]|nr:class I SAM-dependent methyltransferase [bacterium]HNT66925.1 class I SAM-dependent methyltransferase [bacterium]